MEATVIAAVITAIGVVSASAVKIIADRKSSAKERPNEQEKGVANFSVIGSSVAGNLIQNHSGVVNVSVATGSFTEISQCGPAAAEVIEAVRAARPFERLQVQRNYVGIAVCWQVRFSSVIQYEWDDIWSVTFMNDDKPLVFVTAIVSLSEYPRFKVLGENHLCWIKGWIKKVSDDGVWLEENPIIFFDTPRLQDGGS